MTDLLEFLRAQLDEDERVARAAAARDGEHWHTTDDGDVCQTDTGGSGYLATGPWGGSLFETGTHMARHDPARVLAEVDAKRRILDGMKGDEDFTWLCKLLAMPYAGRPGYHEDWRP